MPPKKTRRQHTEAAHKIRQTHPCSVEDALSLAYKAAEKVRHSYCLTPREDKAVHKCVKIVMLKIHEVEEINKRRKKLKPLQVHQMLRTIQNLLGWKGVIVCALAISPAMMESMTSDTAMKFPYNMQRWWNDTEHSSMRLVSLAEKLNGFNPDVSPMKELKFSHNCIGPLEKQQEEPGSLKGSEHYQGSSESVISEASSPTEREPLPSVPNRTIKSTILPLTVSGIRMLLKELQEGGGTDSKITLPHESGYLPFITIPHDTCVKIMSAYTSPSELAHFN